MTDEDVPSPIDLRDPTDAASWIAKAEQLRPWRPELRAAIAQVVHAIAPRAQRVLELGPGPGWLAETILERFERGATARYTLLDFSPPMLARCRERLAGHACVRAVLGDYSHADWPALVREDAPFDAVVAMQSVHEVRHKRHVPTLYRRVHDVVRTGGFLIVCDHEPLNDSGLYATVAEQHAALTSAGFAHVTTVRELNGQYVVSGVRIERVA